MGRVKKMPMGIIWKIIITENNMPEFLEQKLKKEYGNNPHAIYGTMNKIGAMHGNKETKKGMAMEKNHDKKIAIKKALKKHG